MSIFLRRLRADDIAQVVEIEKEAFSPLWISTPFKRELNNRFASYLVACVSPDIDSGVGHEEPSAPAQSGWWKRFVGHLTRPQVKEPTEEAGLSDIVGYVSVWYQGEEAHITEIAVREKLRGRGIGELLLIGSLGAAVEYGSRVMTLEARVSNFIAQNLYEKYGFKSVGIRKGYYSDNREDAVIMTTDSIHTEEYQDMFEGLREVYRSRWGEICIEA
jgi:ribosomal-protein-alanine N-acetyltransferase